MASGRLFRTDVFHEGLGETKTVTGKTARELENKASRARDELDARFAKRQLDRARKERADRDKAGQVFAEKRTADAEKALKSLNRILRDGLVKARPLSWDQLKLVVPFDEPKPLKPHLKQPDAKDAQYRPNYGVLGRISPKVRRHRLAAAQDELARDLKHWRETEKRYQIALRLWEQRREGYLAKQAARNQRLDVLRTRYLVD